MRHCYLLLFLLLAAGHRSAAQSTLLFTVRQAPPLVVDAGPNQVIRLGEKVRLGGGIPASGGSGTYAYSWIPITGLDRADIANPTASPAATTRYQLTVQDPSGCSKEAEVTVSVSIVTATRATHDPLGLRVYPNPNQGRFTLASEQLVTPGLFLLEVYSPLGQRVYTETIRGTSQKLAQNIQLSSQAPGLYLLRLTGPRVNQTLTLLVH